MMVGNNQQAEYESDSQKIEATAAKLPKGSKERGMLYDITSKMQGIVSVIAPYKESEIIRAEQWDWLPTSSPFYDGNSGFVAVQQQWAINDEKTLEEARFQTEMPVAGRAKLRHNPYMDSVKNSVHMHGGGVGLDAQYKGFFAETKLAFAGKNGDLADVRKDKQWWLKVGYQF